MVRFRHSEYRDFYLTRYTVRSSKVTHPEYFSAPALPTVTDLHHSPVHERLLSVTELYPERCRIELERRDKDFGGRRIRTVFTSGRTEDASRRSSAVPHFNARESIIRSRADAYYLVENTIICARIQDILSVFRLHHTSTSTSLQLVLCVQCRLRYLRRDEPPGTW